MSKKTVDDNSLSSIADAIRTKSGTSAALNFPSGFVSAINNIKTDNIPDDYINIADILIHCTQCDKGTFAGSGQTCANLSIGLNFRPKIIIIMATSPITTSNTGSPYEIVAVSRVYKNDFSVLQDNCTFIYKSGNNAKSGYTASNGLRGNDNNTITGWGTSAKFASGVTYSWYAWG